MHSWLGIFIFFMLCQDIIFLLNLTKHSIKNSSNKWDTNNGNLAKKNKQKNLLDYDHVAGFKLQYIQKLHKSIRLQDFLIFIFEQIAAIADFSFIFGAATSSDVSGVRVRI